MHREAAMRCALGHITPLRQYHTYLRFYDVCHAILIHCVLGVSVGGEIRPKTTLQGVTGRAMSLPFRTIATNQSYFQRTPDRQLGDTAASVDSSLARD